MSLVVLLAFWTSIARAYWPELLPALLRFVGGVRAIGARQASSAYLDVYDNSTADETVLGCAITRLDADYEAIGRFLGREPDYRVPVLVTDGVGPALTDGRRLNLYHDGGAIDLSAAPFFLVLLSEGELTATDVNWFVEGGYAAYVTEEIGRAGDLLGQSTDAWVTLMRQHDSLLPLPEAWTVQLPASERKAMPLVQAVIQGGSFAGWLSEAYGLGALQALGHRASLEEVTGLTVAQAERAWLDAVASQELEPSSCVEALPDRSPLRGLCAIVE